MSVESRRAKAALLLDGVKLPLPPHRRALLGVHQGSGERAADRREARFGDLPAHFVEAVRKVGHGIVHAIGRRHSVDLDQHGHHHDRELLDRDRGAQNVVIASSHGVISVDLRTGRSIRLDQPGVERP